MPVEPVEQRQIQQTLVALVVAPLDIVEEQVALALHREQLLVLAVAVAVALQVQV